MYELKRVFMNLLKEFAREFARELVKEGLTAFFEYQKQREEEEAETHAAA